MRGREGRYRGTPISHHAEAWRLKAAASKDEGGWPVARSSSHHHVSRNEATEQPWTAKSRRQAMGDSFVVVRRRSKLFAECEIAFLLAVAVFTILVILYASHRLYRLGRWVSNFFRSGHSRARAPDRLRCERGAPFRDGLLRCGQRTSISASQDQGVGICGDRWFCASR
ncbi:hypothetical protein RPHASCH2410_CH19275 [Rhizobium phaseoli Ch24-10]|nr:hypothetical protein RPHASCH2410_CH19275 [Rhizobium phaseoli Ch24-10]